MLDFDSLSTSSDGELQSDVSNLTVVNEIPSHTPETGNEENIENKKLIDWFREYSRDCGYFHHVFVQRSSVWLISFSSYYRRSKIEHTKWKIERGERRSWNSLLKYRESSKMLFNWNLSTVNRHSSGNNYSTYFGVTEI